MLSSTPRLREFEREYQRTAWRYLTYPEALARFRAMLQEARLLRPDLGLDWRDDLAPDLAVARALNGLPQPDSLLGLLEGLTRHLEARGIPFMLIGGQAVLLHGQPRFTEDIDATLGVGPDRLPQVMEACTAIGLKPLPADLPAFVAETFVLPARHEATGMRVDLIFSTLPYEAEAISRAVRVRIGAADVPFATAEDLLIHKLFAGRPRDLEDVVGVIRRKDASLDWAYVSRWIGVFGEVPGHEGLPALLSQVRRSAGMS